jgi:hypothetical protein
VTTIEKINDRKSIAAFSWQIPRFVMPRPGMDEISKTHISQSQPDGHRKLNEAMSFSCINPLPATELTDHGVTLIKVIMGFFDSISFVARSLPRERSSHGVNVERLDEIERTSE